MANATRVEWRPVIGYEGLYEVSSAGEVRSIKRRGTSGVVLKPKRLRERTGHLILTLRIKCTQQTKTVHSVVAEAFLGPRPTGMQIRHLDGDPSNNAVSNLAYGTASENTLDSVRHGTHNNARKTTCKHGHPFDGHNGRSRTCSTCRKRTALAHYYRKKRAT